MNTEKAKTIPQYIVISIVAVQVLLSALLLVRLRNVEEIVQHLEVTQTGTDPMSAAFVEGVLPSNGPSRGPSAAPITIIEFSDFQCPYCAQSVPILKELMNKHPDQIRLVYRNFPLGLHPDAMNAAVAAECANEQGHFWDMHDTLFAHQQALGTESLKEYAKQIGLDMASFTECTSAQHSLDVVSKDMADGRLYGVNGTPTFFVNGYRLTGADSIDAFEKLVAQALSTK